VDLGCEKGGCGYERRGKGEVSMGLEWGGGVMRARMALSELMKTVPYGFRMARCSVCTRYQNVEFGA